MKSDQTEASQFELIWLVRSVGIIVQMCTVLHSLLQEQWHIYHSEHHNLYTMYINLPNNFALASNWRESGVHNKESLNQKDYPTLDYCAIQLQEFPAELNKFGWDAHPEKPQRYEL